MSVNQVIPQSRVTITYEMEVNGTKKQKEVPLKQLVVADLSLGNSDERKFELAHRKVYDVTSSDLGSIMSGMGVKLDITAKNCISKDSDSLKISLPIDSMKSFDPNSIAENIPELCKLIRIKELLLEYTALINNNRKLRNLVNKISENNQMLAALKSEVKMDEQYKLLNA